MNSNWQWSERSYKNVSQRPKSLEVLFPPHGDGRTRDAKWVGLRRIGISDTDIESYFFPAITPRPKFDVGHAELGLFRIEELKIIH